MVDQEEVVRLGLTSTMVEEDDLAIARERYLATAKIEDLKKASDDELAGHFEILQKAEDAKLAKAIDRLAAKNAAAAAAADAVIFEAGPQPLQDGQGQAPKAAEVAEGFEVAAEAKKGRQRS